METPLQQKIILGALLGVLVVSAAMSGTLLLIEHVRLCVVGVALLIIYVTVPRTFADSRICVALLSAGLMYTVVACDPAVNGLSWFGAGASVVNKYRVLTGGLLALGLAAWMWPLLDREHRSRWRQQFELHDQYVMTLLAVIWFGWAGLEIMAALAHNSGVARGVIRSFKCADWLAIYLLTACGLRGVAPTRQARVRPVLFGLFGFCGLTLLVGAVRVTSVYYTWRLNPAIDYQIGPQRQFSLQHMVTNLARVFSLDAREAMLVYEAGYADGARRYAQYHERMTALARTTRHGLLEAELGHELQMGDYRGAIRRLEAMPESYLLSAFTQERVHEAMLRLPRTMGSPYAQYLAGLLAWHNGDLTNALQSFDTFLAHASNHANAVYFRTASGGGSGAVLPMYTMPASGWFASESPGKTFVEHDDYATLLYNQRVTGNVWLPTGAYDVVIWARDDGTAFAAAQASQFDPACKATVNFGDCQVALRICTTNRVFLPYRFATRVTTAPAVFTLEFTNDLFDGARGWDRNLSIARVDFRPRHQP